MRRLFFLFSAALALLITHASAQTSDAETSATIVAIRNRQQQSPSIRGYRYTIRETWKTMPMPGIAAELAKHPFPAKGTGVPDLSKVLAAGSKTGTRSEILYAKNGDLQFFQKQERTSYRTEHPVITRAS
ncbi:hypothetical protein BH09SUM1_BH09SUM1_28580 [soil metagenome]